MSVSEDIQKIEKELREKQKLAFEKQQEKNKKSNERRFLRLYGTTDKKIIKEIVAKQKEQSNTEWKKIKETNDRTVPWKKRHSSDMNKLYEIFSI